MKIVIKQLELTNFKCFRHKEITFDSDITTIKGRNGVGKTTIADAILWCLFGKNSAGQTTFDLKTHDEQGNTIPNLDHSVEMLINIFTPRDSNGYLGEDYTISLKRTLRENWVKKRGSDELVFKNNTTDYFVNGEAYTAKDYEKYISQLVNEDIFRAITNPAYFPSLKWQQQREFLTQMVGYIAPEEIATTDELADLVKSLVDTAIGVDIIGHRKHLAYMIKGVKDKLDKIPTRLEEQNKALPELLDWDKIKSEAAAAKVEYDRISDEIIKIKSGNGGDVLREQIRTGIKVTQQNIDKIEDTERKAYNLRRQDHDNKIAEASRKFNSLLNTQKDIEAQLQSFDTLKKRCQETLDQCEKDAQKIREEWAHNLSRTFHFHEADGVCPTCGQYLPEEQIAEKRQKAEENLNADKARIKAELTAKAEKVKTARAEAEKELQGFDDTKAQAEKNLADIKQQINVTFSDKAKLEKESVLSYEQALADNVQYVALSKQLQEQQQKLDSVGIDEEATEKLADLEAQKTQCSEILSRCNTRLATKSQYDKIQGLISDIEKEQKDLVAKISDLERKDDVARQYQDRQNEILEERINQHFSLVRWKMFRTVNNGGDPFDEPYCECYSPDGSAYHDGANQAMRLNMGLDIINTLCKHYNVSAPIILDNAESAINIIPTAGQQIRLAVADTDWQLL